MENWRKINSGKGLERTGKEKSQFSVSHIKMKKLILRDVDKIMKEEVEAGRIWLVGEFV